MQNLVKYVLDYYPVRVQFIAPLAQAKQLLAQMVGHTVSPEYEGEFVGQRQNFTNNNHAC